MKKFFAFVVAMAMTVVANAGVIVKVDELANTLTITSDIAIQEVNLGKISADAGAITVGEIKGWGAGGHYDPADGSGVIWDYGYAMTGAGGISGVIAVFNFEEGAKFVTIGEDPDYGFGSFLQDVQGNRYEVGGTYPIVPEPMTMSLLALGGLVAARRRNA